MAVDADFADVLLLALPVPLQERASEHYAALIRELELLAFGARDGGPPLPAELVSLIDALTQRYAAFSAPAQAELARARANGDPAVDLHYRLPATVTEGVRELGRLLDAADEVCGSADYLLTLAPEPEIVAYRRWFLGEFTAQIDDGMSPVPWPVYEHAVGEPTA